MLETDGGGFYRLNCDQSHTNQGFRKGDHGRRHLTRRNNVIRSANSRAICHPGSAFPGRSTSGPYGPGQVDPQHAWVLLVPPLVCACWVPALFSEKLAQVLSPVWGGWMGTAVIVKLLAVGVAIVML